MESILVEQCVKCGAKQTKVTFHRWWSNGRSKECLDHTCICGYKWVTPTLDAKREEQK